MGTGQGWAQAPTVGFLPEPPPGPEDLCLWQPWGQCLPSVRPLSCPGRALGLLSCAPPTAVVLPFPASPSPGPLLSGVSCLDVPDGMLSVNMGVPPALHAAGREGGHTLDSQPLRF